MRKIIFFSVAFFLLPVAGCLDFGENIETEEPTAEQLAFCQSAMYLNDQLAYEPIGLRIDATGIDAVAWFCFYTEEEAIERIFDSEFVSADSLSGPVSFYSNESMPAWWDVDEKVFEGGTVSLNGGIHMTVGIHREERGSTVYIFWCES
ncbi:MAG: hypothetical protein KAH31_00300 [Candidatus Sabulitectum sp.]|nr:hypothetical protein [Candidatus Sabulitectum sp.]